MKKENLQVAKNSANLVEERKSVQVLQNEEVNAMSILEEDDEKLLYEIRTQKGDFQYFRNGILTGEKALILDVPDDYVFQTVEMCCYFSNQGRDFLYCFYDDLAKCYTESKTENLVV